jgi:hypothetical protein
MAVLGRAGKLPKLELRKARRLDRDSRLIWRNDLESVAMIADLHSGIQAPPWHVRLTFRD